MVFSILQTSIVQVQTEALSFEQKEDRETDEIIEAGEPVAEGDQINQEEYLRLASKVCCF